MPLSSLKASLRCGKTAAADAAVIGEAVSRPEMRVPIKIEDQPAILKLRMFNVPRNWRPPPQRRKPSRSSHPTLVVESPWFFVAVPRKFAPWPKVGYQNVARSRLANFVSLPALKRVKSVVGQKQ
ncbi:MAG: hypothetical protein ACREC9_14205 [Methylocella sp.]